MEKLQKLFKKYRRILPIVAFLIFSYPEVVKWSETQRVNIPVITKYESIRECKKLVLERLKSPSTAKFSDIEFEFYKTNEPSFAISQKMKKCNWNVQVDVEANRKAQEELTKEWQKWNIMFVEYNQKLSKLQEEQCGLNINQILTEDGKRYNELIKTVGETTYNKELIELRAEIEELKSLTIWNDKIDIKWNIDSENSFSAMVRWPFSCKKTKWNAMTVEIIE